MLTPAEHDCGRGLELVLEVKKLMLIVRLNVLNEIGGVSEEKKSRRSLGCLYVHTIYPTSLPHHV